MQELIEKAVSYGKAFTHEGKAATYIPELSKADPSQLGISAVTGDGRISSAGDYASIFTVQSISKVVSLMLAIIDRGEEYVFSKVGMEATGDAFNSIIKLETAKPSKPLNPMINAGAIAIDSLIAGKDQEDKFRRLVGFFRRLCGNEELWYNERVYASERDTGYRNRALAHFMKDVGVLEGEVEAVLDLYFKQCSIQVDCRDIAMLAAVLAFDGISPVSGEVLVPKKVARLVKTFMVTCGMYDGSGEFAIRVGIPAKSGVGGGILAVVPGRMGIGVFSPALDARGNSVGGVKALEFLSEKLELSIF